MAGISDLRQTKPAFRHGGYTPEIETRRVKWVKAERKQNKERFKDTKGSKVEVLDPTYSDINNTK